MEDRDQIAAVDPRSDVHESATVWHLTQLREHAVVGPQTTIGRGCYIGVGVFVGAKVKIQNSALIYEPAVIEDGAFIGPGVIFTNDHNPRSVNPDFSLKTPSRDQARPPRPCEPHADGTPADVDTA